MNAPRKEAIRQQKRCGLVWVCSLDHIVVKPADIHGGRHVRERDEHGAPKVLCGYVRLKPEPQEEMK